MEKQFKIIRTYSAWVFAWYVENRTGKEAIITDAIRLWYWSWAASLSQLAVEGVKNPWNCKFSIPVSKIELTEVIEILDVTKDAEDIIKSVKPWKL